MTTFLRAAWLPTLVVLTFGFWIWLDKTRGWKGPREPFVGALLAFAGVALALWCAGLFRVLGRGTPLPFTMKTQRLVISGPYRIVRNPMMFGVGAFLIGCALCLGSVGLWFGFAGFVVFVSFFVPLYEERDMERRFGNEYRDYCRRVPRWFPRLRRPRG